ncbi:MAG TPA: hypothetical protein VGI80_08505, partial [Pyrinomonadaceae bacterium]
MKHAYNFFWLACVLGLLALASSVRATEQDLQPVDGIRFTMDAFDQHRVVAIADLAGCDQLHQFIRKLVAAPEFRSRVNTIVVGFGNPIFQSVMDRYVMDGELVPRYVLRHVWDDANESPDLTWDSPVYEEFFDTVRSINLITSKDSKLRVVLGGSPIVWRKVENRDQWMAFQGEPRAQALAAKVNDALAHNQRVLVIDSPGQVLNADGAVNARSLVEKTYSGQFVTIL